MGRIHFYKYQATGNDFVVIDNRNAALSLTADQVTMICDRRLGVGADGLMLIEQHPTLNFNLAYYNSDGTQSLCGNGSRAAVQFASRLGMVNGKSTFNAFDGEHSAEILDSGIIRLKMNTVKNVQQSGDDYFINTGSPHVIKFFADIYDYPVLEEGRKIRYSESYKPGGTNVNFVALQNNNTIFVRTYERGVEDETRSCGTGVTAAALAASYKGYNSPIAIKTLGGNLSVEFKSGQYGIFEEIFLVGPAKMVFEGDLEL
ncbi:MAG: diaminopimelate epimerase [Chryseolinea sp.]